MSQNSRVVRPTLANSGSRKHLRERRGTGTAGRNQARAARGPARKFLRGPPRKCRDFRCACGGVAGVARRHLQVASLPVGWPSLGPRRRRPDAARPEGFSRGSELLPPGVVSLGFSTAPELMESQQHRALLIDPQLAFQTKGGHGGRLEMSIRERLPLPLLAPRTLRSECRVHLCYSLAVDDRPSP